MRTRARTVSGAGNDEGDTKGATRIEASSPNQTISSDVLWTLKFVNFSNMVLQRFVTMVIESWFDEENGGFIGPFSRFLTPTHTEFYIPSRVVSFLFLGCIISAVLVFIFGDDYVQGKQFQGLNATDFPLNIAFYELGCVVLEIEKPILFGLTGEIRPGKMTGILGKSGSGKTTLAHALLGRDKCNPMLGDVYVNGYKRSLQLYSDRVGFVPQQDVMYPELTVEEILNFSASWRLPLGTTEEMKRAKLEETLSVLDLTHLRNRKIGSEHTFSAMTLGQKKRVSIGMELIASPSVLIMDEPTTGLDSSASFRLMKLLREISLKRGVSVVTIVHQPSTRIFNLFDDIILLEGGGSAFVGERQDILPYFKKLGYVAAETGNNPAEFVLDILVGIEKPMNGSLAHEVSGEQEADLVQLWELQGKSEEGWTQVEAKFNKQRQDEHNTLRNIDASESDARLIPDDTDRCNEQYFLLSRMYCFVYVILSSGSVYETVQRPGVLPQSLLWIQRFLTLMWRRRAVLDLVGVAGLGVAVSFTRSYCKTWNRRPISYYFMSIALSLLGMLTAVLNDEIGPAKRAVAAGMSIGAHEVAYVFQAVGKGIVVAQVFSTFYHLFLYLRTGLWCCEPYDFWKEWEFVHIVLLCYLCAHGIGSFICVAVNHDMTKAYVSSVISLIIFHVLSWFSPNQDQIRTNSMILAKFNSAPVINFLCSLSYVRYFMEGMLLWEPEDGDDVGRNFTKRIFGYIDEHKSMCFTCLFAIWASTVISRVVLFYIMNANVYNSLYDVPMVFTFAVKIVSAFLLSLVVMTVFNELPTFQQFWFQTLEEVKEQTEKEQEENEVDQVDILN